MAILLYGVLTMMGRQGDYQNKFFITGFNLDKRIAKDHILRRISEKIDFNFIYKEVKETYGRKGNVSVPPPIILKMLLLLVLYNVRSERELMATLPLRLDWLWFLGYDLESEIPNHSVLSKARARWGVKAFKGFFERIVWQCVEAGLVEGGKVFIDASLIDADASNNSVVDRKKIDRYLNKTYQRLEKGLDDLESPKSTPANSRFVSTTDPDAAVTRHGKGKSKLRYKTHRAVDPKNEIITATQVTPGSTDDADLLEKMLDSHEHNTRRKPGTVVADSKYGKIDNFLMCHDQGIKAHMPSLEQTHRGSGRQKGIFPKEAFTYDPASDTFTCPAGQILKRGKLYAKRKHYEYKAPSKACRQCHLKEHCTRSKTSRTLKRHLRQDELDLLIAQSKTKKAKRDIKKRQDLSERSFARSTRYGYKRARWRGLWRMQIQDLMIAVVQNITVLVSQPKHKISKSNVEMKETVYAQHRLLPERLMDRIFRWRYSPSIITWGTPA